MLSIPPEDGRRRPVLVATHGAGGTPEAHCSRWSSAVGSVAFVLCPRGVTMDVYAAPGERGYFYSDHPALEREVRAALEALRARFPERVDLDRAAYAGFSQGGIMGALFLGNAPAPFATAILMEGGAEEWDLRAAHRFQAGGGRRLVFACGRPVCATAARRSAAYLTRAGVEVRVVDASGAGHTLDGPVLEGVLATFPWLVAGDERWR